MTTPKTAALHFVGRTLHTRHYGHIVQDWTYEPADVLAWCKTGELAIGAWEKYASLRPHRETVVRWDVPCSHCGGVSFGVAHEGE